MLRNLDDLHDFALHATDGLIGHVKDCYFDDHAWVVRFLVVETGNWLSSRKVLVSPISLGTPDWTSKELPVSITRDQVRNSPDIDTAQPVTRQHVSELLAYYAYPFYWNSVGIWEGGSVPNPSPMEMPEFSPAHSVILPVRDDADPFADILQDASVPRHPIDSHLRSSKDLEGYRIHATDGEIGHVEGLLVDEKTWAIRYIVANTSNWWIGYQVLIPPGSIKGLSWYDGTVTLEQTMQQVRDAPQYHPDIPFDSAPGEGTHTLRVRIRADREAGHDGGEPS